MMIAITGHAFFIVNIAGFHNHLTQDALLLRCFLS